MAYSVKYDDVISGGAIAAALAGSQSGAVVIPYANGMRVLILED